MGFIVPSDVDEQTRLLGESGVASKSLNELRRLAECPQDISIEMCKFWATLASGYAGSLQVPVSRLTVVVMYPNDDPRFPYLTYGVTIATSDNPGLMLTPDEFALVSELAGTA